MTKPYKCRVEYLQSDGNQYIDMGVGVKANTIFKAIFSVASTSTGRSYFGARNSSNERFQIVNSIGIGGGYYLVNTVYPIADNKYEIEMRASGEMYLDGVKRNATTGTFSQVSFERNLWLFATNYYDSSVGGGASTFWKAQVFEGNTLVRDFIPVLDNSGRPAMYDNVSGQLFYNLGSGEFTYGRKIIPVEYLESIGEQYIDTGIKGKNNIDFDYKVNFTNVATSSGYGIGGEWESQKSLYLGLIRSNGNFAYHYANTNAPVVVLNSVSANTDYSIQGHMWSGEQYMVINGTKSSVGTITGTFVSTQNIALFRVTSSSPIYCYAKIYYLKIWDNNTLVRDFIPCIDENNVPFMFDLVNCKIYENAGTGQFKVGANVDKSGNKNFLRKKLDMYLATLMKKRPYYCEVEYLESTNQQTNSTDTTNASWIDTGIVPDNTTQMECRVAFSTLVSGTNTEALFGSTGSGTGNYRFAFGYASISPYTNFYVGLGGQNITTSITRDTNVHTFKIDAINKTWAIDDTSGSFTSSGSLSGTTSIFLFARHNPSYGDDKANKPANARTYYCKIWQGGSLVRDMIPVLDWNYIPCMYDKITGQLFYTQGTKDFSYGREIHYVDYLESTGTQYIDTGYKPVPATTKFEFYFSPTTISGNYFLFGVRPDTSIGGFTCTTYFATGNIRQDWAGLGSYFPKINVGDKVLYSAYNNTVSLNNDSATGTVVRSTDRLNYNFLLFTVNTGGTVDSRMYVGKVYYAKLWDNGTLVRDYLPAIDENGVGFMFDRVTHTCFLNAGTGAFVPASYQLDGNGRVVEPEYE